MGHGRNCRSHDVAPYRRLRLGHHGPECGGTKILGHRATESNLPDLRRENALPKSLYEVGSFTPWRRNLGFRRSGPGAGGYAVSSVVLPFFLPSYTMLGTCSHAPSITSSPWRIRSPTAAIFTRPRRSKRRPGASSMFSCWVTVSLTRLTTIFTRCSGE